MAACPFAEEQGYNPIDEGKPKDNHENRRHPSRQGVEDRTDDRADKRKEKYADDNSDYRASRDETEYHAKCGTE